MSRPAGEAQTWGLFLALSAIWGTSYLFIKIGLEEGMAPLTLVSLRTILGAGILAAVMLWKRVSLPRSRAAWRHLGVVGMTNIVLPFVLITWGELSISSGMAGILTAMVPLFAVVLASLVLGDEPVTVGRAAGLVIGFGGVVLLASPSVAAVGTGDDGALAVVGMISVVLATASYAVAAVYTRHRLSGKPIVEGPDGSLRALTTLEISFGQAFVAMLVITPVAVLLERPDGGILAGPATGAALFSILWLGLLGSGLAYVLYFAIIARWGATRATLITYVMPIVAVAAGFVVLGETLRPVELVGAGLIIAGVVLVNAAVGRRPLFVRAGPG